MRKIFLLMIFVMFLLPLASAMEWDNVKEYNANTRTATITNALGFGETIAEIQLLSEQHREMRLGDYAFEIKINSMNPYSDWFNKIEAYDYYNNSELTSNFRYEYWNEDYTWEEVREETECDDNFLRTNCITFDKTHTFTGKWLEFNEKTELPKGEIRIRGYYLNIKEGQRVEWIPTMFGERIHEWADFTAYTLYEYYNTGEDAQRALGYGGSSPDYICQNFTIGTLGTDIEQDIAGVSIKWWGDVTEENNVSHMITNSTGSLLPNFNNSAVLCRNNSFVIPASASSVWRNISMYDLSCPILNKSTMYWLCFNTTESAGDQPGIWYDNAGTYTGGELWEYNTGGSGAWSNNSGGWDLMFEIYGTKAGDEASTVNLHFPTNATTTSDIYIPFNCSASDDYNIANVSIYINNTRMYNVTGTSNFTELYINFTLQEGVFNWTCQAYDNSSQSAWNGTNYTLTIDTSAPIVSIIIPSGTINISNNDTNLNFTRTDESLDTCWYSSDGGTTNITITNCNNVSINITHGTQTVDVWVNDTLGNTGTDSNSFHGMPLFARCNSTLLTAVLNYTFKDEGSGDNINATIDDATFVYWVDNPVYNITYTNSSTKNHSNIAFCVYPNQSNITTNATIRYSETGYPQRTHTISSLAYNNSTSNEVLYMLASGDGQYVVFQVLTSANQPISEVQITIERYSAGSYTLIETGETGGDGSATFFLNPNYQHRLNFTKTGYDNLSTVLTPTQTQYTVVLGESTISETYDLRRGVSYKISPTASVLNNMTIYTFNFSISSNYWDLTEYGFILKNSSGTELGRDSGTAGTGSEVTLAINTTNHSDIIMYHYFNINGNYTNGTRSWMVMNTADYGYSIRTFFEHLKDYTNQGIFGLNAFSRALIVFVIIFIAVGLMSYYSGIYSAGIILIEVAVLITLFDYGLGIVPNPSPKIEYFPTIFAWVIAIAVAAGDWFK